MSKKPTRKKIKISTLIVLLVAVLAIIQVYISQRLAVAGELMRVNEEKAVSLEKENQALQETIGEMGSLTLISEKARKLGLANASNVWYLTPPVEIALNP